MPELPFGQWWDVMPVEDYMAIVEARRQAHLAESLHLSDLAWRTTDTRVSVGPPLFPRIR